MKGGDKLDLGGGHVMEFVMAPNLHWPDTMFSFDHATGALRSAVYDLLSTTRDSHHTSFVLRGDWV